MGGGIERIAVLVLGLSGCSLIDDWGRFHVLDGSAGGIDGSAVDGSDAADGGPFHGWCLADQLTFGAPTLALDHGGEDWDPTVTEDGTYMVFSDGELHFATRPGGVGEWAYGGPLDIQGIEDPAAPVISRDGNAIIVHGAPTSGGDQTLYELRRTGPSAPFVDPTPILDTSKPDVREPGLDVSWTVLVGSMTSRPYRASRATTSTRFEPIEEYAVMDHPAPRFPALSRDGLVLAFASTARGEYDLYLASRGSTTADFDTPTEFPHNTTREEHDPWITYDSRELYFARYSGSEWDIWVSTLTCEDE